MTAGGRAVVLATAAELEAMVRDVARRISDRYPDGVVLIGVLKGSVLFLADLMRRITVPVEVDFLAVTPFASGAGRVRLMKDLDGDIAGRDVVLVEDLVDTGLTITYLRGELARRDPASVAVATLLDKPARRLLPVTLDFVGREVPDVFVLGYGLDFAGRYRNLHGLWAADAGQLAAEPDHHLLDLYG